MSITSHRQTVTKTPPGVWLNEEDGTNEMAGCSTVSTGKKKKKKKKGKQKIDHSTNAKITEKTFIFNRKAKEFFPDQGAHGGGTTVGACLARA